jgi:hypothetical protein
MNEPTSPDSSGFAHTGRGEPEHTWEPCSEHADRGGSSQAMAVSETCLRIYER